MAVPRSLALHAATFIGGAASAISVMSSHAVDLYAAWGHLYTGARELFAAWSIILPILSMSYAAYLSTTRNKLLDAAKDPKAPEIAASIPPTPQVVAMADALKKPVNGY